MSGWSREHIVVGAVVALVWGAAPALTGLPSRLGRPRFGSREVAPIIEGSVS
jgi:hypothetical protein